MVKKTRISQVAPDPILTCSRCEDEDFNNLASDLLKRSICCILLILSTAILAIMGVVVFFSAIYSNNGYEYCLTVLCEVSAGLLLHIFLKEKVKIVEKIREAFIKFGEKMDTSKNNSHNNFPMGKEIPSISNHGQIDASPIGQWLEHFDAQVRSEKTHLKPRGRLSLPCVRNNELQLVVERTDENGSSPSAPPLSPG